MGVRREGVRGVAWNSRVVRRISCMYIDGGVHGGVAVRIVLLQGWVVGMHAHTCTQVALQYRSSVQQYTRM